MRKYGGQRVAHPIIGIYIRSSKILLNVSSLSPLRVKIDEEQKSSPSPRDLPLESEIERSERTSRTCEPVDPSSANCDRFPGPSAVSRVFRCAARYLECNFTLARWETRYDKREAKEREREREKEKSLAEERRDVRLKSSAFTSRTTPFHPSFVLLPSAPCSPGSDGKRVLCGRL